ncbi:TPA: carboxypeptidase regulatory-like domain-containing protein [Candidatus Poribacteria bacterium]|nr:carboxypeptidase regulatory-like domain-containing protein [Candidatus Poribacteria bacterium]
MIRRRGKLRVKLILATVALLWLFAGCGGEEADKESKSPVTSTPDVATLTGKVTLEGADEHDGVNVSLFSDERFIAESKTDADGNYSIGLKKTGRYTLKFTKDNFVTVTKEIDIVEGENAGPEVTLEPGGLIQGSVEFEVKPDDTPQMVMTVVNEADNRKFVLKVGKDEKYLLTVPPGIYTITIEDTTPDSKFTPFKKEGVEVKVGDVILIKARMSTWPYFEAEDATEIRGLMKIEKDPLASGGKYIVGAGEGSARFDIMFPETGEYVIWGRVLAKDGGSDSFFVGINIDQPEDIWDLQQGAWTWDQVNKRGGANPVIFKISKGMNTLVIRNREVNSKLDKIFITSDLSARP